MTRKKKKSEVKKVTNDIMQKWQEHIKVFTDEHEKELTGHCIVAIMVDWLEDKNKTSFYANNMDEVLEAIDVLKDTKEVRIAEMEQEIEDLIDEIDSIKEE